MGNNFLEDLSKESFSHGTGQSCENLWQKLNERDLNKNKQSSRFSLKDLHMCSSRYREDAVNKLEHSERLKEALQDDIDDIIRRTGVKEVSKLFYFTSDKYLFK